MIEFRQNKYIPIELEDKPLLFLSLPHREALYGGAAGGGKSEALLAAALQYAHVPGYSGILFRRSLTEHKMANNLIPRAKRWLQPFLISKEVIWNASDYEFIFKTKNNDGSVGVPATLKFGYCDQEDSHLRYQGGEFQFIGWDELTQIKPSMYEYLFSRLRKKVCPEHKLLGGEPNYVEGCMLCEQSKELPLRIRSATNPGNRGHQFVKDRFKINKDPKSGEFFGNHAERPFIPAFVKDNPHINQKEYLDSLKELDPVKKEQLMNGDWDASPDSLYRKEHLNYYTERSGSYIVFSGESFKPQDMRWFFTSDIASTRGSLEKGDSTVLGLWGLTKRYHLGLFDAVVFQKEIPDVIDECVNLFRKWHGLNPECFVVEKNGLGIGVSQSLTARGLPVMELHKSVDKVQFAQTGIIKTQQGRMYFPTQDPDWKKVITDQLFVWQGLKDEPDDVVDMVSTAHNYVNWTLFDETHLSQAVPPETKSRKRDEVQIRIHQDVEYDFPSYF
jgi:phage terminase large subunit-like protein